MQFVSIVLNLNKIKKQYDSLYCVINTILILGKPKKHEETGGSYCYF